MSKGTLRRKLIEKIHVEFSYHPFPSTERLMFSDFLFSFLVLCKICRSESTFLRVRVQAGVCVCVCNLA